MDKLESTTSFGMWRFARDYCSAGRAVQKSVGRKISSPAYFLTGHSIELCLKAFLLGRGVELDELRSRKFGHDLEALLNEARRRKLGREVKLSANELSSLRLLNHEYKRKQLEYIVTGFKTFPKYSLLEALAAKLVNGLQRYCYFKTFNKSLVRGRRVARCF